MRYRQLDENGDDTFGQGSRNFLVDSPEAVAQAVMTRLRLEVGEWFLDVTEGTPYQTRILGYGSANSRDIAIRDRIIGTQGVLEIVSYSSSLSVARKLSIRAVANTIYGELVIDISQGSPTGSGGRLDWRIEGNILFLVVN